MKFVFEAAFEKDREDVSPSRRARGPRSKPRQTPILGTKVCVFHFIVRSLRNFLKMSGMTTSETSVSGVQASSSNVTLTQEENRNLQVFGFRSILLSSPVYTE
jgi:hypothetical protein